MLSTDSDIKIIKQTISENIQRIKGKELYIFGCVVQARDIRDELQDNGCVLEGFVDNNPGKAGGGKKCLGVPVLFPVDLKVDENKIIIICSKYFSEMKNQLEKLGFSDRNILRIPIDEDAKKWSDDDASIKSALEIIEKGNELYEGILKENPNLDRMFICPYPGTGDIYMACTFLPKYLEINKICNYVVLVIGNSCKKVAELFEKEKVISITREQSEALLRFWEFSGDDTIIKPLLYWGWRTKRYLYADHYPQISFSEMFVYDVFEYDDRPKTRNPIQESKEIVEMYFKELGLALGKTVIIAPYAGSFISEISYDVWKMLAKKLMEKGFSVCTNCSNESEETIEGTKRVCFPYAQAVPFVECAGYFIGIRSGLCDVISSAKCKKIIMYEDAFNATRISFFGLKKMGLCESDVFEFDYSGWNDDRIVAEIVEKF